LILIAQLYGSRSPQPLVMACRKPGRLIVEDCAQSFDGTLRLPKDIDAALYSFGPIKVATALGGAVGLFRDPRLPNAMRESWRYTRNCPRAGSCDGQSNF
jgi:dTDP-4-amino-4,6-dideoxygalactose transaminase